MNNISNLRDNLIIKENEKERRNHISSGKLTAGYLYQPKRFQLLKYLGVKENKKDIYLLRKFRRGKNIEDEYISDLKKMGLLKEEQIKAEYRNCIGIIDALVDHKPLKDSLGVIPHEIKSVTSRNFKYINEKDEIGKHYLLQAGFYALAKGTDNFAIDFINSDDNRLCQKIVKTRTIKQEIDKIIDEFEEMIEKKLVPEWQVLEKWMNDPKYHNFDIKWVVADDRTFREELKKLNIDY